MGSEFQQVPPDVKLVWVRRIQAPGRRTAQIFNTASYRAFVQVLEKLKDFEAEKLREIDDSFNVSLSWLQNAVKNARDVVLAARTQQKGLHDSAPALRQTRKRQKASKNTTGLNTCTSSLSILLPTEPCRRIGRKCSGKSYAEEEDKRNRYWKLSMRGLKSKKVNQPERASQPSDAALGWQSLLRGRSKGQ